jgi:hypothetical protein
MRRQYSTRRDYSSPGRTGSTSTLPHAMTTRGPAVSTLLRLHRASGCAVSPLAFSSVGRIGSRRAPGRSVSRLDHTCVVRPGAPARRAAGHAARHRPRAVSPLNFSSVGRTGSNRASCHCVSRRDYSSFGLHWLYCAYVVHPDVSSRRSTSCRSVPLALIVHPVTVSRGATTHCPDCTGSTAPIPCIQMCRLAARLLIGRSHWLSLCVRSLYLAARLLVVRIAPALLRLCRASGRTVSPLDFSTVGRTGSRHASGHCVSQCDYSSSGLHRLYCAYVVHPDASSCHSTSRRSVALALVVRPVTPSRGVTTRRPDCTSSTAPMSCIRTHCLAARLLVGRSYWLSPCVRSLHLAARLLVVRIALALLCLCRASGCVVSTLDFSSVSRTSSHCVPSHFVVQHDYPSRSRNGYTSTMPRVRVPRHIARLVARLDTPFVVNFDYVARPGASALRAARRRLRCVSGCLGTSRGSSHGLSRRSSSTTLPTPRVRVPRHVARLVTRLVVDYFDYAARSGASARRAAHHAARRRLLRAPRLRLAATLALLQPRCASRLLVSRQQWLYFEYVARCRDVVFQSHHVDHSS